VVYLTSRPIVLAPKTRAFLTATEQDGEKLPLGPLHCCLEKVTGVLFREVRVASCAGRVCVCVCVCGSWLPLRGIDSFQCCLQKGVGVLFGEVFGFPQVEKMGEESQQLSSHAVEGGVLLTVRAGYPVLAMIPSGRTELSGKYHGFSRHLCRVLCSPHL